MTNITETVTTAVVKTETGIRVAVIEGETIVNVVNTIAEDFETAVRDALAPFTVNGVWLNEYADAPEGYTWVATAEIVRRATWTELLTTVR